jgi:hypothetical protein
VQFKNALRFGLIKISDEALDAPIRFYAEEIGLWQWGTNE